MLGMIICSILFGFLLIFSFLSVMAFDYARKEGLICSREENCDCLQCRQQ